MLVIGSGMVGKQVLSLHVGGAVAQTISAVIDPENLKVIAYTVDGPAIKNDPEVGDILVTDDVREVSNDGFIIDSTDILATEEDVVRIKEIMSLNFDLIGLRVVTRDGRKIGKVIDYTLDSSSFMVYQLIVQRSVSWLSLNDPTLTINRSQIIEIDDYKVTIKHDKEEVKVEKKKKTTENEIPRDFVNPFRKPAYDQSDESSSDNSSSTSE